MTNLEYLQAYFEFNRFTLYLAIFVFVLAAAKLLKLRINLSDKQWFWALLFIGIALRLAWVNYSSYAPLRTWSDVGMQESDVTNIHAIELTRGIWFHGAEGLPSGRRPIGYPLLLGIFYKLLGVHDAVAWGLNLALYATSAAVLFYLTKLLWNSRAGFLALTFYTLYPVSIYSIKLVTDEHLFVALFLGGIYLLARQLKGLPVKWPLLWYGLIFGYATMTRTHSIFMPFVVGLVYLFIHKGFKRSIAAAILVFSIMQFINLPWVIRNYKAWGVPVVYTATACFVYSQVNETAQAQGGGHLPESIPLAGSEGERHKRCSEAMKKWILGNPTQFLSIGVWRPLIFMGVDKSGGVWPIWFQFHEAGDPSKAPTQKMKDAFEHAAYAAYYLLFFLFVFGYLRAIFSWKRLEPSARYLIIILSVIFIFWWMEHMVIYPDRKYRYPLEPLMMVFAAYFMEKASGFQWTRFGRK